MIIDLRAAVHLDDLPPRPLPVQPRGELVDRLAEGHLDADRLGLHLPMTLSTAGTNNPDVTPHLRDAVGC